MDEFVKDNNYYGDFSLVKEPDPSFKKSDARENLILGKPQKIKNFERIVDARATDWFNTPASEKQLTDGVYAKEPICQDPEFFHFTAGAARSILYDFGGLCAVDGFAVGALKENSTAVRLPARVCLQLSENGTDWQTVGDLSGFSSDKDNDIVRKCAAFGKAYKARYAKITFMVVVHIWLDQIEIFGKKNPDGAYAIVPDDIQDTDFPDRFASTAQLGAKDVLLSYICGKGREPITKEIYLPHVAYIEDGKIKDTLFDSVLYLPYVNYLYDGGTKRPLKKEDWQYYVDVQYQNGVNMDALDEAAKEVGEAIGDPDYKVGVFLSILYPVTAVEDFGEINGRHLNFKNVADRKEALKWLIDIQKDGYDAKKYKHLKLLGYYWFTEEINYGDAQLLEMLHFTTDYVRTLGLITTWIPYFNASGFNDWRHLGFDIACYQPNYAFNQKVPDKRLFDAANTAKLLGMCIELEMGGTDGWNIERMKKYYAAGAITGYMKDAAHLYYQGGVPGYYYSAYISEDPNLHSIYKDTYDFIKGNFDPDGIEFGEE